MPGVSRSGATISAGLFLGLDRELAARFGFLLAIPAVFASGLFSLPDAFHPVGEGMSATGPQLLVATLIAFVVGFAAVSWFLKFLVRHSMYWFVGYRVMLGAVVLVLLGTGVVAARMTSSCCGTAIDVEHRPHAGRPSPRASTSTTRAANRPRRSSSASATLPIKAIVRSPLLRCERTVEPLAAALGLDPVVDERISEVDYGAWTGRKIGELVKEPLWAVVQQQPSAAVFPDGEGLAAVQARAVAAVREHDRRLAERAQRRRAVGGLHARRRDQGHRRRRAGHPPGQFSAHHRRPRVDERDPVHGDAAVRHARQPHRRPR